MTDFFSTGNARIARDKYQEPRLKEDRYIPELANWRPLQFKVTCQLKWFVHQYTDRKRKMYLQVEFISELQAFADQYTKREKKYISTSWIYFWAARLKAFVDWSDLHTNTKADKKKLKLFWAGRLEAFAGDLRQTGRKRKGISPTRSYFWAVRLEAFAEKLIEIILADWRHLEVAIIGPDSTF